MGSNFNLGIISEDVGMESMETDLDTTLTEGNQPPVTNNGPTQPSAAATNPATVRSIPWIRRIFCVYVFVIEKPVEMPLVYYFHPSRQEQNYHFRFDALFIPIPKS